MITSLKLDKRLRDKQLRNGQLSKDELSGYLEQLTDLTENVRYRKTEAELAAEAEAEALAKAEAEAAAAALAMNDTTSEGTADESQQG